MGAWAGDSGLDVHHRLPLEWQHLFDGDANALSNLAGMLGPHHTEAGRMWTAFRTALDGATPTPAQVLEQVKAVDSALEQLMKFIK